MRQLLGIYFPIVDVIFVSIPLHEQCVVLIDDNLAGSGS